MPRKTKARKKNKQILTPPQYKLLSEFCRETSQTVILVSLAAYFLPPAISLEASVSFEMFLRLVASGLTLLITSVILVNKGKK